jgi:Zn-dependent protease with chaperone function
VNFESSNRSIVLKGHGISRAINDSIKDRALASEEWLSWLFRKARFLFLLCFFLVLMANAARICPAQSATSTNASASAATSQPASPQAYSLPPEKLAKAITLNRIRIALDFVGSLWGLAFLWILLATRWAARLAAWTERLLPRRWMQGLAFFAAFLVITALADLPLGIMGHTASLHYGISVQGWASWTGDEAKSLGLSLLIATPILLLFNWIVRRSPRRYWLWAWLVSLPLIVLSTLAEPLLEPVFNHYEPLAKNHYVLVAKLEQVVARTGTHIAPERMYLMKASEKSNGLNAYVTGIGATKRFVLWDTATDRLPDDEVLFIFGHESGHYVLNHIPQGLIASAAGSFFLLWGCSLVAGWLARRFGPHWGLSEMNSGRNPLGENHIVNDAKAGKTQLGAPSIASFAMGGNHEANRGEAGTTPLASRPGFLVLLLTLSAAGFFLQPVTNAFSRHIEHEADIYGQEAIHGLVADPRRTAVAAFNAMGGAWLEDPNPSPFVEFWSYSHPSVQHRAEFAQHYDPWANGGHGRFFDR